MKKEEFSLYKLWHQLSDLLSLEEFEVTMFKKDYKEKALAARAKTKSKTKRGAIDAFIAEYDKR